MSHAYVTTLLVAVVLAFAVRLLVPVLPVRRYVVRLSGPDVLVLIVGAAALVLHCGAMFFRASVASWPLGPSTVRVVDPMGTASITWYALGAALIVFALRRQHPALAIVVAASLAVVGYTMYDGGPLRTHLDAIFTTVILLAATVALFADPPWRGRSVPTGASAP